MRTRPRRAALVTLGGLLSLLVVTTSGATTGTPGTAAQVAALVAAAPSIKQLPANVTPSLANAANDDASHEYPAIKPCIVGLLTMPACAFGDTHGSHTMVLWGDSHAYMWFPALDAIAKAARWRLVAYMGFGCPVADVTVWNVATNAPTSGCPAFRAAMIKKIDKLNPSMLVMSEGFYTLDAHDQQITGAQWRTGLEATFSKLHSSRMKKVLIGDTYLIPNPIQCLAANPSAIQTCSQPEANSTFTAQRSLDRAAALASKVTYVDEIPWTCSQECTVVIGSMIAYYSAGHISATYSNYLSGVLRAALKRSMR